MTKENIKTKADLPLFQKLHMDLERIIDEAADGQKIQSEPELAVELGVSRATLREAMRTFESQGRLLRRQGVGTFVHKVDRNIENGLEVLESIETQAKRLNMEVRMGHLNVEKIRTDREMAEKMEVFPGSEVIHISRVIWADEIPVAYLVDNLIEGILNESDMNDKFTGSVLDSILKRGQPKLSYSKTAISAVTADAVIAKKLQIQRVDSLLKFSAYLYDVDNVMIDYSESYFTPGYFQFTINRSIGK